MPQAGQLDLLSLALRMSEDCDLVCTQKHKFKKYKFAFSGADAVQWLCDHHVVDDAAEAVVIGEKLERLRLIRHVNRKHAFKNAHLFYRFHLPSSNEVDVSLGTELVHQQTIGELAQQVRSFSRQLEHTQTQLGDMRVLLLTVIVATLAQSTILTLLVGGLATLLLLYRRQQHAVLDSASSASSIFSFSHDAPLDEGGQWTAMSELDPLDTARVLAGVAEMRAQLQLLTPLVLDLDMYSDAYLASVMTKFSSKDVTKRRSFAYSKQKFIDMLEWKERFLAVPRCPGHMQRCVADGSLYWHGYDFERRPILWVRAQLKDWSKLKTEDEVFAHVTMIDAMIRHMAVGVTTFVVVSDASNIGLRQVSISLMRELMKLLVTAYPDRLHRLYAGPVNQTIKTLAAMLMVVMPARLSRKIRIVRDVGSTLVQDGVLLADDVPDFFGGPASHQLTSDASFSFEAMIERNVELANAPPAVGASPAPLTNKKSGVTNRKGKARKTKRKTRKVDSETRKHANRRRTQLGS